MKKKRTIRFLGLPVVKIKEKQSSTKYSVLGIPVYRKKKHIVPTHTPSGSEMKLSFDVNTRSFSITDYGAIEIRNISMFHLLAIAMTRIRMQLPKSFDLIIKTADYAGTNEQYAAFCRTDEQQNVILIPDFTFDGWATIGVYSYKQLIDEIVARSKEPYKYDKLFWIGSAETHPSRVTLCEMSLKDERIEAIGANWKRETYQIYRTQKADKFVTFQDHTEYKYLIDLQGYGYSGRLKVLLFTGRPLFIADRKWKEYFYEDLKPFVHYIPVKEDLSDLTEKLDWAEAHYDEAVQIAKNAQEYALSHLTQEKAIDKLEEILMDYSQKYGTPA